MKSERIVNLENAYRNFCIRETFRPGDIVTWKNGMTYKMIDDIEGPDSGYFREPLDIIVGFLNDKKTFVLVHLDSRRLCKV